MISYSCRSSLAFRTARGNVMALGLTRDVVQALGCEVEAARVVNSNSGTDTKVDVHYISMLA